MYVEDAIKICSMLSLRKDIPCRGILRLYLHFDLSIFLSAAFPQSCRELVVYNGFLPKDEIPPGTIRAAPAQISKPVMVTLPMLFALPSLLLTLILPIQAAPPLDNNGPEPYHGLERRNNKYKLKCGNAPTVTAGE